MSFLKTYLHLGKREAKSSTEPSSSKSLYLAQNGSHVLISPRALHNGEHADNESHHLGYRGRRQSAKSSPLPMGNPAKIYALSPGHASPTRMGLVGSAKVIQTLGAENSDEQMQIIALMQRPMPSTSSVESFRFSHYSEEEDSTWPSGKNGCLSSEALALRTSSTPATCEVYLHGHAPTGHVTAHESYPEFEMDKPRCSSDGFINSQYGWARQEESAFSEFAELKNTRSAPRNNSVSSLDCSNGSGPGSYDRRNTHDSPQLSPHRANHHQAVPLPTPPASPSKSDRARFDYLVPQKLPLPPMANILDKELEINQRSQRINPWKTYTHSQSPSSTNTSPGSHLFPVSSPKCPRNWTLGKVLGKGSFGTVYEGLNTDDGSFFAVKVSDEETTGPEIQQEVDVLRRLNHPNIVRYLGSSVKDGHLCIFLELGKDSLRSVLNKYKRFEENLIRIYTRQILQGLEYLHQQNTVHRDIKCSNILVYPNGQVKLADFGVAKQMSQSLANSCKGTLLYMAPEMIEPPPDSRRYGLEVDIWSLGCTIIEMADGKGPWSHLKGFSFFFKVSQGELPPIPELLSSEAKDFIRRCLKWKPEERANVSELLHHPFVTNAPAITPHFPPQQAISSSGLES